MKQRCQWAADQWWLWQRWGCPCLWLWPSQTSAMALCSPVHPADISVTCCRAFRANFVEAAVGWKRSKLSFVPGALRMFLMGSQGWKQSRVAKPHCQALVLWSLEGNEDPVPLIHFHCCLFLISMRWGLAVVELGSSFLKCNIYPVPLLSLSPQWQNWFSWCCCTFNVPFYVHVCSNRVATSTDDLNLYHPQTDNAGATSLSLSLLVYLI